MKGNLLDIKGKEKNKIDLPKCFDTLVRRDIIAKVIETKKVQQPYAPSPVAGSM